MVKVMDYFCSICGSGFEYYLPLLQHLNPQISPENYQGGSTYEENNKPMTYRDPDQNVMNNDNMRWLGVTRLMGKNNDLPEAPGFLTGIGRWKGEGVMEVDRGFDPNVPVSSISNVLVAKGDYFSYEDYGSLSGNGFLEAPDDFYQKDIDFVHDACIKIFTYALKLRKGLSTKDPINVNWTIVYDCLHGRGEHGALGALGINPYDAGIGPPYFEMNEFGEDKWFSARHGLEPYLVDPLKLGDLWYPDVWGSLFNPLGRPGLTYDPSYRIPRPRPQNEAEEAKFEWYKKIKADMPWMWEIHEGTRWSNEADWQEIYNRTKKLCFLKEWNRYRWYDHKQGRITKPGFYKDVKGKKNVPIPAKEIQDYSFVRAEVLGMSSRRRIWQCLEPIITKYLELEAEKEEEEEEESSDEEDEEDESSEESSSQEEASKPPPQKRQKRRGA